MSEIVVRLVLFILGILSVSEGNSLFRSLSDLDVHRFQMVQNSLAIELWLCTHMSLLQERIFIGCL